MTPSPKTRRPPWRTDRPGSFAHNTLKVRVPQILRDTVAALPPALARDRRDFCDALGAELASGALRGLQEETADRPAWDAACAPHLGRNWLDLPWYFAESFFYRRLLEATGFNTPGPGLGIDPFAAAKAAEEAGVVGRVHQALTAAGAGSFEALPLPALLRLSLWGNRADLSYTAGRAFGDVGTDADLLVDDTSVVVEMIKSARRVALVLDNAGTELSFDLGLAHALRAAGKDVTLHAKAHPFFVSDATPTDVARTAALLGLPAFSVSAPPFWTSAGFFFAEQMPAALIAEIAAMDLVILKGDANYRRLVGDVPWAPEKSRSIGEATDFPAAFVALRTCKAEVLEGVPAAQTERAAAMDPLWLVNGRFGLIQACSRGGGSS